MSTHTNNTKNKLVLDSKQQRSKKQNPKHNSLGKCFNRPVCNLHILGLCKIDHSSETKTEIKNNKKNSEEKKTKCEMKEDRDLYDNICDIIDQGNIIKFQLRCAVFRCEDVVKLQEVLYGIADHLYFKYDEAINFPVNMPRFIDYENSEEENLQLGIMSIVNNENLPSEDLAVIMGIINENISIPFLNKKPP
jgi:hypothetical protein